MPTTVNGIGTHYYGKSNRTVRKGACRACGSVGELQSYDTRLWFVVVFIPVIPLGRKTIIDECPACRRHFVTNQDEYAMARQLSLSGAREQFREDPAAETAVAVHAQMLGFHAHDDAATFRDEALAQFPDDAMLHAAFGTHLDTVNDYDRATKLFERAYQLDPQLPEARQGLALRRIVDGKLDEARKLIDYQEAPGAGQLYPLDRLEHLATAYQKAGRHAETLELCRVLVREFPAVAEDHKFRKFVATSEKKVSRGESLLPAQGMSLRALFDSKSTRFSKGQRTAAYAGVVALLATGGLAGLNEFHRRNRTVHLMNDFAPAAKVTIDGAPAPDGPQSQVVLSEGTHHVKVTGAIEEEFDVDLSTDYWQRWTYRPTWIINIGGASPVELATLYYAENPRPSESTSFAGQNLCFVPHVDYLFTTGPASLHMDSRTAEVVKQQLTVAPDEPWLVLQQALGRGDVAAALRYAESRLKLNPADDNLLAAYDAAAIEHGEKDRANAFLKSRLNERPVQVNWHRMYQELHASVEEQPALQAEYDELLAAEPNNAALLYLRGRITSRGVAADEFFDKSIASDPQISWPWVAKGYRAGVTADWATCKECYEQATRLGHPADHFRLEMMQARLGLGEAEALAAEYREAIASAAPIDSIATLMLLTTVLSAQNNPAAARQAINEWQIVAPVNLGAEALIAELRALVDFNAGEYGTIEQQVAAGTATEDMKLYWMLATGKAEQAAADSTLATALEDPWKALALSLAFDLAGRQEEARTWRDKACDALSKLGADETRAAEALQADAAPTRQQLDDIGIEPADKSLFAAALAVHFPDSRAELGAHALQLGVTPGGYTPLVRQAAQATAEAPAP
jgi:tetratricopeptide (TPR) repeat protein